MEGSEGEEVDPATDTPGRIEWNPGKVPMEACHLVEGRLWMHPCDCTGALMCQFDALLKSPALSLLRERARLANMTFSEEFEKAAATSRGEGPSVPFAMSSIEEVISTATAAAAAAVAMVGGGSGLGTDVPARHNPEESRTSDHVVPQPLPPQPPSLLDAILTVPDIPPPRGVDGNSTQRKRLCPLEEAGEHDVKGEEPATKRLKEENM